jgi:hypothetical protein
MFGKFKSACKSIWAWCVSAAKWFGRKCAKSAKDVYAEVIKGKSTIITMLKGWLFIGFIIDLVMKTVAMGIMGTLLVVGFYGYIIACGLVGAFIGALLYNMFFGRKDKEQTDDDSSDSVEEFAAEVRDAAKAEMSNTTVEEAV